MTDSEHAAQIARIEHFSDKWLKPLGLLSWWRLHFCYDRAVFDTSEHSIGCVAFTKVSWEYLEATITFALPGVEKLNDEELEYVFVHECMHILVAEMRDLLQHNGTSEVMLIKHEERVCTTLALAFIWTKESSVASLQSSAEEAEEAGEAATGTKEGIPVVPKAEDRRPMTGD